MAFKLKFDKTDLVAVVFLTVGSIIYFGKSVADGVMKEGGHEYVDLGLSVYWATENLGCCESAPIGSFYSWGAHELPDAYTVRGYKWTSEVLFSLTKPFTVNKYCTDTLFGNPDFLTKVEPEDDAVVKTWGEGWRTPTYAELCELVNKCKWHYKAERNGFAVVGPNGKSIFLPMTGYNKSVYEHLPYGPNTYGCYWSASLDSKLPLSAKSLFFERTAIKTKSVYRYLGFAIRPVRDK